MMNKPAGVISATYDGRLKTVTDLLPDELACFDLFPAGRLDIDTEGLVLLTNDGQLAHNLMSPKSGWPSVITRWSTVRSQRMMSLPFRKVSYWKMDIKPCRRN